MSVSDLEQANRPHNFLFLCFDVVHRQMGMYFAMGPDFEKRHGEQLLDLGVVFGHPTTGHEKRRRHLVLDQEVDQLPVESGGRAHGA